MGQTCVVDVLYACQIAVVVIAVVVVVIARPFPPHTPIVC